MKTTILVIALSCCYCIAHAQFIYKIKSDSVLITNDYCNAELNLENSTKNISGFLFNKGNGRTEFRKGMIKLNDSTYIIGTDTLRISNKSGSGSWLTLGNAGTNPSTNFLGTTDSNRLVFRTNNTEKATILPNGNILVGQTTDNGYKLEVNGSSRIAGKIIVAGNGSTSGITITTENSYDQIISSMQTGLRINAMYAGINLGAPGNITMNRSLRIYTDNDGSDGLILQPTTINTASKLGTQKLTIGANQINTAFFDDAGRLGIGVSAPSARMHLAAGISTNNSAPLKFTSGSNLTTPENGAVEFDGTNYFVTSSGTRYTLAKTLTATGNLNFGSTASQSNADLTITVTGAADGDVVSLGVPNAAVNTNSSYSAWVSATNTVTVRFNNYSSSAIDPASASFRVSVAKY